MTYEITVEVPVECHDEAKLIAELEALGIPNVRTYSVFGRPGECVGVYAWRDDAPIGEYHHAELSEEDATAVRQAIEVHHSGAPVDPIDTVTTAIVEATSLDELKMALLEMIRQGQLR